MKRRAIINLGSGGYIRGQKRLRRSLKNRFDGDLLFWTRETEIGAPPHKENPYAFKVFAFQRAIEQGYTQILWLDASVYAIQHTQPIWDEIDRAGYIMQYAGWNVGQWANDRCLEYFDLSRDDAMVMGMYGNAGFLGLDLTNDLAKQFLAQWTESAKQGIFKGAWKNDQKTESQDERCLGHRHDMVCGSIIASRLGMEYKSAEEWLEYAPPAKAPKNNTIILKAQGLA